MAAKKIKEPVYLNAATTVTAASITSIREYNPKYGDQKKCMCGHTYNTHFNYPTRSWNGRGYNQSSGPRVFDHSTGWNTRDCKCTDFVTIAGKGIIKRKPPLTLTPEIESYLDRMAESALDGLAQSGKQYEPDPICIRYNGKLIFTYRNKYAFNSERAAMTSLSCAMGYFNSLFVEDHATRTYKFKGLPGLFEPSDIGIVDEIDRKRLSAKFRKFVMDKVVFEKLKKQE
jgi:hypothetical protein